MKKLNQLKPVYVEFMPKVKEHGNLYISERFGLAIHLCACGCGIETVTGFKPKHKEGWTLTDINGVITLRPSIGNFKWDKPTYHAHYYITENKIDWL